MRNDRNRPQYIRRLQEALNGELGLRLPLDGMMSARTRRAIRRFQSQNGLTPDGIVRLATERALLARNDAHELEPEALNGLLDREIQQSGQSLTNTRAQYEDLLTKIRSQLERRFTSPNDPMLLQRRQELRRLFSLVPSVFARELFSQLQNRTDPLGSLLTSRLAPVTRTGLLGLLQNKFASVPSPSLGPMRSPSPGQAPVPTKGADLPLILAGPIVRRATADKVWFWFACSKNVKGCRPRIILYNTIGQSSTPGAAPTFREINIDVSLSDFNVVRLGENIWIVLLSAAPKLGKFLTDFALGYDLDIATEEQGKLRWTKLSALGLEINYHPFPLPTCVIGELNRKLVHGSCRRPGAQGDDAFLIYDKLLSKNALDPFQRPASLILTGDQIYADDLSAPLGNDSKRFEYPLFDAVRRIARDVFGYVEHMPNAKGGGLTSVDSYSWGNPPGDPIPLPELSWSDRRKLTHRTTSPIGFTTEDGEAHLLSFPEYAAMHLAVWNPDLRHNYKVDNRYVKNLDGFSNAAKACRRVMANTATYMLFDDHEITDDWNLDQKWRDTTQANPLARRIIANGLAAYWSFQAWGNAPEMFKDDFLQILSSHFEQLRTNNGLPSIEAARYDQILLGKHWSFIAESNPKALCIDTRTSREFPGGHTLLSGELAQKKLGENLDLKKNFREGEIILLVTPTPFLPHHAMIMGQEVKYRLDIGGIAKATMGTGLMNGPIPGLIAGAGAITNPSSDQRYLLDYEVYANYPPQQAQLMRWLQKTFNPSAVVIFSGDVHHGSVVSGRFAHGANEAKIMFGQADSVIRIVQITSSPIKNLDHGKFVDPVWDGKIKGVNVLPVVDPFNLLGTQRSVGDIGKAVVSRDRVTSFSGSQGTFLLQSRVWDLDGDLNSETYIYKNHLCVVDMPAQPKADVKILFVGAKNSDLANGEFAVARASVDTDNDPSKLKFTVAPVSAADAVKAGLLGSFGFSGQPDLVPPPN